MELRRNQMKYFSSDNMRLLSSLILSLSSKVQSAEDKCITEWEPDVAYIRNQSYVTHDNKLYVCVVSCSDSVWTPSHFQVLSDEINEIDLDTVKSWLNLSQEELDNLQKLLKDDQITTTSTFSSSKIYSDLQTAIDTAKTYTNNQLGKAVKPAYKVVSSTSEVTETGYFYLISNGTNYDMYVLSADGSVVSLGTSDVDLTQFYDKDYIDNNFYTSAQSDGKFATITTVDGKVDKTDIVDNLTSTDTDKPLSANQGKVLKDDVDLKANDSDVVKKTDIVTTIDATSTDDKVPTAKAMYNKSKNKIASVPDGTDIIAYTDSISKEEVTETVRIMNSVNSPYGVDNTNNDFYYTIYNILDSKFKRVVAYDIRKNDMYMIMKNGGNWTKWQRVCTTSVADVPLTTVSLDSSKFLNGHFNYEVKNGICYVYINALNAKTTFVGYDISPSPMPKPSGGLVTAPIVCDYNGATIGLFYIDANYNSRPRCHIFAASLNGYVTFSYTVAES